MKSLVGLLVMGLRVFGGFRPQISFYNPFLGDLTEGEKAVAAFGILLPAHNAVLDGFLNHLQGPTRGTRWLILC